MALCPELVYEYLDRMCVALETIAEGQTATALEPIECSITGDDEQYRADAVRGALVRQMPVGTALRHTLWDEWQYITGDGPGARVTGASTPTTALREALPKRGLEAPCATCSVALETVTEHLESTPLKQVVSDGLFDPSKGELIASAKMSYTFPQTAKHEKRIQTVSMLGQRLYEALRTFWNEGRGLVYVDASDDKQATDALCAWENRYKES